jgi:ribosomal-protein-alanine N-acetyltransferase
MALLDRFVQRPPPPILRGKKVWLRQPQSADWEPWAKLRDESRSFLTPWEPAWPIDALSQMSYRQRLRRQLQDARDDLSYAFFIFREQDGELLGGITLANVRRGVVQSASVGYWLGERYVRHGYMRDALTVTIRHSFDDLRLHRIEAACLPTNHASLGVLRACGFRDEGYARKYLCINSVWQDHVLLALLASDPRI